MRNMWSENDAAAMVEHFPNYNHECVSQAYATRLLGSDPDLALHGGGNTSVKADFIDILKDKRKALYVKPSGCDMRTFLPDQYVTLDLEYIRRMRSLESLTDESMKELFKLHMLQHHDSLPSIETLLHAFLPFGFVTHTHPAAILALTNREGGMEFTKQALGRDVAIMRYGRVGYELAHVAAGTIENTPGCNALVVMHHGLVTWGDSAKDAYDLTIDIVSRAESFLQKRRVKTITVPTVPDRKESLNNYKRFVPFIRKALCADTGDQDRRYNKVILKLLNDDETLGFLGWDECRLIAQTPPLTPDYLIRTRMLPLYIDRSALSSEANFHTEITEAVRKYVLDYRAYIERNRGTEVVDIPEPLPRVLLIPGIGAVCAASDSTGAEIVRDITQQALKVKQLIYETDGIYEAISEEHLFDMEFRSFQRAKLDKSKFSTGSVAIVTGSAGAIGSGICAALLEAGYHVAVTDLSGPQFESTIKEFTDKYGNRVLGVRMDVTSQESVESAFTEIIEHWGGIDILIVNAGIAHVASLNELDLENFRKLERVNVEGALLTLRQAGKYFTAQQIGGDIVLVSTKNVFAPGAKFGAYSATKAASHQLARIASIELAQADVRVNMVAPDAVFSHGVKKSGLWAEVGPDRMKARGLDENGLEEYYRNRNLLRAKITADHVARAILFFISRQTPTTGATIPVDGGLPDATPR